MPGIGEKRIANGLVIERMKPDLMSGLGNLPGLVGISLAAVPTQKKYTVFRDARRDPVAAAFLRECRDTGRPATDIRLHVDAGKTCSLSIRGSFQDPPAAPWSPRPVRHG